MILLKIIGVFWLSVCSMFSYGTNESCFSENENNTIELSRDCPNDKNIAYVNYYYHIGFSEFGNEIVYNSLLSALIEDASIESINFTNYDAWYNGRYFRFVADDIGYETLTSNDQYHKFRYSDNSIYILLWSGSAYSYNCYGVKVQKVPLNGGTGALYYAYTYSFPYPGSDINGVGLSYFANNHRSIVGHNFGFKYKHYIYDPGHPDYPLGLENHAYTAFGAISSGRDDASYNIGFADGFADGQNTRVQEDYDAGYQAGLVDGALENPEISAIFTGILNVGLLPVNVFLEIFNFELFGVSVSGLVSGLLTMSIIVIIIRFLFGGKNDK